MLTTGECTSVLGQKESVAQGGVGVLQNVFDFQANKRRIKCLHIRRKVPKY